MILDMNPSTWSFVLDEVTWRATDADWLWRLEFCRRWFS